MLLFKGTCAPVALPFKGQEDSAPVMHPRSGVPGQVHGPGVIQLGLQFTYAPLRGQTWERILLLLVFIA